MRFLDLSVRDVLRSIAGYACVGAVFSMPLAWHLLSVPA